MLVIENLSKVENLEGKKYKYIYRITKSSFPIKINEEIVNLDCYGIETECEEILENCVVSVERSSIEKISTSRYKVHNLVKLLYDNSVSPIHLVDVIGEYVDEYVSDFDSTAINLDEQLVHSHLG